MDRAKAAASVLSLVSNLCRNHMTVDIDTSSWYSLDMLRCLYRGLVDYCAPLCYLYAQHGSCAAIFCSMYARFWCRLHTIDDTAGKDATLISLCVLFLHLLEV